MPYPPHQPRQVPTTRESVYAEFTHADGKVDAQGSYTKVMGSSPEAQIDARIIHQKVELCCGCYWPDVEVGGVCGECNREGTSPNVCTTHFVVCRCGAPCCWKHSRPLEDDNTKRLCLRCDLREKNKALKATFAGAISRAARRIFFK